MADDDGLDEDEESIGAPHPRVMQQHASENPYIGKVFAHKYFGQVPPKAIELLERVSPDGDELLIYATRTSHGALRRGYLLLTTHGIRWVQTLPTFDEDLYSFDFRIEYKRIDMMKGMLVTHDGRQFQLRPGKGKAVRDLFMQVAQAITWETNNTPATPAPTAAPPPDSRDLATQLKELGELKAQGLLDDSEFEQAKARLLQG
jgi:hypothetical protein